MNTRTSRRISQSIRIQSQSCSWSICSAFKNKRIRRIKIYGYSDRQKGLRQSINLGPKMFRKHSKFVVTDPY